MVVSPRDRDIFLISAEKATEACRNAVQQDRRIKQFEEEFLTPLNDWCVAHADRVKACYIPVPEGNVRVFIVTNSRQFDFDFAEEVAALELRLAKAGWEVGSFQLPLADDGSLATFFNPDGALEVYAEGGAPPQ